MVRTPSFHCQGGSSSISGLRTKVQGLTKKRKRTKAFKYLKPGRTVRLSLRLQQQRKDPEADVIIHMERDACPGQERAPPYRKHCSGSTEGKGSSLFQGLPWGKGC